MEQPIPITQDATMVQPVQQAIDKGLAYLRAHQYPNGEFCAYISGDDAMQGWCQPDSTVFPSALIGACLLHLKGRAGVNELLVRTADFLRAQMGRGGTWNHFTKHHPLYALCPMDADDTACVSSFLSGCGIGFPKDQNTELLLHNRRRDGLFYTWFSFHRRLHFYFGRDHFALRGRVFKNPLKSLMFWRQMECKPDDVDAIVNGNVLYYLKNLSNKEIIINNLINILKEEREEDCDKWYRHPFSVYYFISRNVAAGLIPKEEAAPIIEARIRAKAATGGSLGDTPLHAALALSTLLNLGTGADLAEKAADHLINTQQAEGCWPRWRLYYGGPKKITGYGSEEVSTAFCLEALARYAERLE